VHYLKTGVFSDKLLPVMVVDNPSVFKARSRLHDSRNGGILKALANAEIKQEEIENRDC